MGTIIIQEWKASRQRIIMSSIVLAAILLGGAAVNFIAYETQSGHLTFFGMFWYVVCLMVGTWGIPLYALIRGSGNMRSVYFTDTNYLMLMVPQHSYTLLGGKQIVNLAEYLIYLIPSCFYLTLLGPTAGLMWHNGDIVINGVHVENDINAGASYWKSVRGIYETVFGSWQAFATVLQLLAMTMIIFVCLQATLNCAFAIYSAVVKSKRPHKFMMALLIFFMFYIQMRASMAGIGVDNGSVEISPFWLNMPQTIESSLKGAWIYIGRFAAFGAAYFALTSWLTAEKIEV